MDYEQLEARFWHALAFLKEEALGALGAIWRPLLWTWGVLTVGLTLLLAYPNWHHSATVYDFVIDMIATVGVGTYCGVFVGGPIAVGNFLWRLFGWGTVVTIVLAPPAFLLTTVVFSPVLIELGGDLVQAFSVAYENRGGGALPAMLGEGGPPVPPSGSTASPEPNMGIPGGGGKGGGILLAIFLLPIAVCVIIDLAYVSFAPAVLWSAAWFLGAVALVLGLAILAALAVSVPALAYNFYRRARERYDAFNSSDC